MKTLLVLCALAAAVVALPADTYNPKYDDFDVASIVDSPRLLEGYGKCFLDEGPCTAEGKDFKKTIPEALRTSCAKCTPKQRSLVRAMVNGFKTKKPELWERLRHKQDPNGEYTDDFNKFLSSSD